MTEAEWNAGTFSTPLFEFLRSQQLGTQRQRFLLALACCQAVKPKMSPAGRQAVAVAERFVTGEAKEAERAEAMVQAGQAADAGSDMSERSADWCAYRLVQLAAERESPTTWNEDTAAQIAQVTPEVFSWTGNGWHRQLLEAHRTVIADWVRDVFHPFLTVHVESGWLTPEVVALARDIREREAFEAMTALADALTEAGCRDNELLDHLRDLSKIHVKGCWVLEALLNWE